ncbi:GGDEF domain-containing protein [Amycolatopsis sp. NPDC059021]|uniref:sensor domain-containing diguanylate cyclase n=1 Tax=Amycolatopsis sp. NPDC059021 TaxID=3346704 RepID=UPI00366D87FD
MQGSTTPRNPGRRGRRWEWLVWAHSRYSRAYVLLVMLCAIVVVAVTASAGPPGGPDLLRCALITGLGVAAAELGRQIERRRRRFAGEAHINFTSVWTFPAALLLPPVLFAVVALVLYLHLLFRCDRDRPGCCLARALYNTGNVVLSCEAAAFAARRTEMFSALHASGMDSVLPLVAAIGAYFVVNMTIAAVPIALWGSDRSLRSVTGTVNDNILELATLCLGALTAVLLVSHPWLLVLMFVPLYALHRSALVRQFEVAATTDAKTGLLNAAGWHAIAGAELDRARQHGTGLGVLMIDIDHFRRVNNTLGHLAGDDALHAVGDVLRAVVRGNDQCGRFGGEEFVVVLPGSDPEAVLDVAERIRTRIAALRIVSASALRPFGVTVSIGVASYPGTGTTLAEILLAADHALLAAKDGGRDQVRAVAMR